MTKLKLVQFFTGLIFFTSVTVVAQATDIYVPQDAPTIEAALAISQFKDHIILSPGTYQLTATVDATGRVIMGDPYFLNNYVILGPAEIIGGSWFGVSLEQLSLNSSGPFNSSATDCSFLECSCFAIGAGSSSSLYKNCTFTDGDFFAGTLEDCHLTNTWTENIYAINSSFERVNSEKGGFHGFGFTATSCVFDNYPIKTTQSFFVSKCIFKNCAEPAITAYVKGSEIDMCTFVNNYEDMSLSCENQPGLFVYNSIVTSIGHQFGYKTECAGLKYCLPAEGNVDLEGNLLPGAVAFGAGNINFAESVGAHCEYNIGADQSGSPLRCEYAKGDFNGDGIVNGADLGLLLSSWGFPHPVIDLNFNGIVDGGDLGILLSQWTD